MNGNPRRRALLVSVFLVAVMATACGLGLSSQPADLSVSPVSASGLDRAAAAGSSVGQLATLALDGAIDHTALTAALARAGVDLPADTGVYAVRVDGSESEAFDAGGGALFAEFWPASSVKLLAAVGALEYLGTLGFTGAARITIEGEGTFRVSDIYEAAIADSSNAAYDRLVQIAGVDWLNDQFLTAANGFPVTVIQRSYTGDGVDVSPAMTVVEGTKRAVIPARRSTGTYACPEDDTEAANCSNLAELLDSVRRVTLDGDIPTSERFDLAAADVDGLADALLDAEGFVEPAVEDVLGRDALVYNKPGYVPGDDCVDVALLADPGRGEQYLVGVTTPEDGALCPTLVEITEATLAFLAALGG